MFVDYCLMSTILVLILIYFCYSSFIHALMMIRIGDQNDDKENIIYQNNNYYNFFFQGLFGCSYLTVIRNPVQYFT